MDRRTSSWRAVRSSAFDEPAGRGRAQQTGSKRESRAGEVFVLRLATTPSPDALAFARRCSARAVLEGVSTIYIELDALTELDPTVIGTMISILRDANESSVEVILQTGREDFLEALRVAALDKVFTLAVSPQNDGAA